MFENLASGRRRIRTFLESQIWDQDLSGMSWFRAFLYRQLRVGVIVIKGCTRGRIALRASAMTFTTLLTLIPLLVLAFSIIRALGGFEDLENRLELFILDYIAPGSQEQVRQWMLDFFRSIRSGGYRSVSLLILLMGGLGLLGSIEGSFNDIWGIHRGRSLFQRFSTYTTIIVFAPVLMGLSLSMTTSLKTSDVWDRLSSTLPITSLLLSAVFQILTVLLNSAAFTLLYIIMPNARVRLRAALPAGLAAGILWEISKWGYGLYLGQASHYGALYGSLAGIPLFFLWVYLTWLVVLFGAHLTFASEAADDIRREEQVARAGLRDRFRAGLHIMLAAAASLRRGRRPPDVTSLARWLGMPQRLLRSAAEALIEGGLLHQIASDPRDWALMPARDPNRVTLLQIWQCFTGPPGRVAGDEATRPAAASQPVWDQVEQALGAMEDALGASWGQTTLDQLLERLPREPAMEGIPEGRPGPRVLDLPR